MKKSLFVMTGVLLGLAFAQGALTGAGATFPYPLYAKMFEAYHQETGVQVNYQAIGSGGGQRQLLQKTVNFAASDAPLTDKQMVEYKQQTGSEVLHIPMALGAVVVTYNIPGGSAGTHLKLTGSVLTNVFLGKIKMWNDPRIQSLNPEIKLPAMPITVVHRSDGSGTSYVFTQYLSKVSPTWQQQVGFSTSVDWPTGLGGKGNQGVAGLVQQTPGSFGYVELIYAIQNKLPYAELKNKSGNYILPSLASVKKAADGVELPADGRVSLTDTAAAQGYPISTFTYILLYRNMVLNNDTEAKALAVKKLVGWMATKGQQYNEPLDYSALAPSVVKFDEGQLAKLEYKGQPLQ